MSHRNPCPDCNSKTGLQQFYDGTWCHSCHTQMKYRSLIVQDVIKKTPKILQDLSFEIPESGMNYLRKYRITDKDIKDFKIGWSDEFQRVVFPYHDQNDLEAVFLYSWMRDPTGLRKPKWLYNEIKMNAPYWWHKDAWRQILIITEDVISAIRCSHFGDILALGSTNWNKESITTILLQYDKIVIWLDGDKAGREASRKFCKKWGLLREVKEIVTKQDPKAYSKKQIQGILRGK